MAERELTAEQKEFISSLAVDSRFARNVSKLREVKNAMLEGMSIEEVKREFLSIKKENPNQDSRAESQNYVITDPKGEILGSEDVDIQEEISMGAIEQELYQFDPLSSEANVEEEIPFEEQTQVDESEPVAYTPIKQEDTSALLRMAQEAVQQLNEVKLKYEVMDEFIHKHILEEKNQKIANLYEENRRLKEELTQLQNAIRAAPAKISPSHHKTEVVLPKKRQKKFGLARFWERGCSENYIIRLFSNPKFTAEQIAEIRLGLEADLSESQIKSYAKHEISVKRMREIRMLYETQNRKKEE